MNAPTRRIFLIGYRGTGKSTVAQRLGLLLGWPWVDADVEVELQAGKSIAAIFAEDGEAAFRDCESTVLAELSQRTPIVVGVGGGGVLREENRARLRGSGKLVWLKASPRAILARIDADPATAARRPQLTAYGGLEEIESLLAQREPIYRACADLAIDTEGKSPAEIAAEILVGLQLTPGEPA